MSRGSLQQGLILTVVHAATGMNSATTMLLALVPAGGHIVTTTDCYRRTRQFIQTVLPKMGITATVIDPADMDGLEQALKNQRVSLFFSGEDPAAEIACNPAFSTIEGNDF